MSYARDLTTEQARLHAELQSWAFSGKFGDENAGGGTHGGDGTAEASGNVLCARFCDRLDGIVGSSHFDVDAFERHAWYLRDSNMTGGDKLDALRTFQATVVAKHDSLFPGDDDDDDDERNARRKTTGGGGGRCVLS
ncbi:MAG: hypothetical protein CMI16_06995 [Opitutaceae bacterium]|nr:hypothetical protein [Opitutaceae bacterium]